MFQVLGSNYLSNLIEVIDTRYGIDIHVVKLAVDVYIYELKPLNIAIIQSNSNLPAFLGGSCTCADYGGCLLSDKGPWKNPEITEMLQVDSCLVERLSL